jgi:hypothetical protein
VIHSCAETAFDSMPVDMKALVTKTFGYFHIYTVSVEHLKISVNLLDNSMSK